MSRDLETRFPSFGQSDRDATRESAFDLLVAVLENRSWLTEGLGYLPQQARRDRAAAHRLAATVLRRMGTLDALLEPHLRRPPPEHVQIILRIGVAGLLILDTPPHAAVETAVSLAKARGLQKFAGLTNAVLRKIAVAGFSQLDAIDAPRVDTPAWLWTSWGSSARAIATAHQHEPPLDLTLKPPHEAPSGGLLLPTGSVRYSQYTDLAAIPGFAEGNMWVQDAAAALPAMLLDAKPCENVVDLCAAPGGKTAQLAVAGAKVTALDRDPKRMKRLAANLGRWGLSAELIEADATQWAPPKLFDAILLDAPCSGTGTIRRHPEIARSKRQRDVLSLTEMQDELLDSAAKMLRPGGRLIYSVCSLQPAEGAPRVAAAAGRGNLYHDPFSASELKALPEALTKEGYFKSHPGMWPDRGGLDGFFAARLRKV